MKKFALLLAATSILAAAQPAAALTFATESANGNGVTPFEVSASQISIDFDVNNYSAITLGFTVDQGDATAYNFDSAVNIFAGAGVDFITLELTGGATFDLGAVLGAFTSASVSLNGTGNLATVTFSPTEYYGAELGSLLDASGDFLVNRNGLGAGDSFSLIVNAGAIPEPGTWAMMIGGFAFAGAAMRRRKLAVRFA